MSQQKKHDKHAPQDHHAAHADSAGHEEHKGLINTPKQLIVVATLALIVPVLVAYLGAQYAAGGKRMNTEESAASIAKRIGPSGTIKPFDPNEPAPVAAPVLAAAGPAKSGEEVYNAGCNVCHTGGVAGAPKFADKSAWGDRIAQGAATLYEHAIKGYQGKAGVMPAKGGNTALSDAEVKAAVDFMASKAK
jgi:cytochrome c5